MTLGTNVAGMLILGMANLLHHNTAAIPVLAKPFIACGMVAVSFFGVGTLMTNQFGYDRDGFRMLVLLPTPRWRILLGRNLSLAAVAGVIFLIFLSLGGLLIHLGPVEVLLALLSFVSMFLIYGTLGNLSSVLAPFRIPAGAVQARKVKGLTTLLLMFFSLVSLAVGGLIFVPPLMGWLCASAGRLVSALVTLACAAALTGGTLAVYWTSLKPLGRLLQARERQILDVMARTSGTPVTSAVVEPKQILRAREVINDIYVDDKVKDYIVDLVCATREPDVYKIQVKEFIQLGASPRATINLTLAAKAYAFLKGRGYVTPQDVKSIGMDVLRHRVAITYEAEAEEKTSEIIVQKIFDELPVP